MRSLLNIMARSFQSLHKELPVTAQDATIPLRRDRAALESEFSNNSSIAGTSHPGSSHYERLEFQHDFFSVTKRCVLFCDGAACCTLVAIGQRVASTQSERHKRQLV
jgi:hypothetical protein